MSGGPLTLTVPPEVVEAIAQRAAAIVLDAAETSRVLEWLTLEEAAAHLRLSPAAARKRAERGQLPGAVKDGSRWLVDRRALDAALSATRVEGDSKNRWGERRANGPAPGTGE